MSEQRHPGGRTCAGALLMLSFWTLAGVSIGTAMYNWVH
jgi:hypothetical protein